MAVKRVVWSLLWCLGVQSACSEDLGNYQPPESVTSPVGTLEGGVTLAIANGKVRSKLAGTTQAFLGIPYAKPPVGELRFMPPQPAEPWAETLTAGAFGPSCPQPESPLNASNAKSEDCLSLNVYTPDKATEALPVMVWIHGGGFTGGGSSQYDGAKLSAAGPVVVVTLNYRLGALGFISLPELDEKRGDAPSGNDGLRDQQLALQWVQDNIEAFHGDPSNVTVIGESAGSASACVHFVSPTAQALAHRFIMESGSCYSTQLLGDKGSATSVSREFSAALCPDTDDPVGCLQAATSEDVANWGSDRGIFGAGWKPVVNAADPLMPQRPATLIAAGEQNKGELILGTNKNEFGLFTSLQSTDLSTVDAMNAAIDAQFASIPAVAIPLIKAHYTATDKTASATYVRLVTDAVFRCPTRTLARAASAQGNAAYLYSFEQGLAYHAYEIPYVFGNPQAALGATSVQPLHDIIADYWTSFAKTGTPRAAKQPAWTAYNADDAPYLVLADAPALESQLAQDDCDFWDLLTGD